ncbi:membrane-bound lytic murein transglycosylase MltF [Providencia sp. PROV188]|uniref:membrane-bound lytic murein transglycosylase MltF n=1 Tax=Providencia TaxID=586 RepID=UPI0003E1E985|nr:MULTISPECIES: membrane-bound lytic murein transglycosylase MltF [Providencia]ETT02443.1 membrane-bound lytic murein transglycosylase F [Providencia alcalifaciens PAL-3]EUD00953.1 membrane-bound lytic murein transglycosylase F [Providencia alcalifaciens PAL-1]MBG5882703.1 membrane-bound lytic murein transglycosylase MltF [Providencia alcalifaciens]MDR2242319.1 membrane-bound lytic murein transglycosylase MltF [Providencia alcalifaciens]MDR2989625.1 membrane-bound lytic murein transglycosylas
MNNLKVNYFIIVVIALLATMIIGFNVRWSNTQNTQVDKIISRGELRISAVSSPLIYIDEQRQLRGFDYELAQGFATYLGIKLKIIIRPTIEQIFEDLDNDDADIAVAGLLYNKDRLETMKTGPSYLSVTQQLVYRKGTTRPKTFNDLKGKLMVIAGSTHASTLKALSAQYPNLKWEESSNYTPSQLLEMVAEGEIDYTLEDSIAVSLQQRIHPKVAVAFDLRDDHAITWYLSRQHDNSLDAALLDFFNLSNQNDLLARLIEKHFSHVESFDYFDTITFISAINNKLPDYQPLFEKYAETVESIDWKLLAAIAWQESHWNPLATSPTGVRGIMMLTKPTAATMGIEDRLDPEGSIKGGAAYLAYIMKRLPDSIAEDDRIWFTLAAYNMGYGHMLDVRKLTQRLGGNPDRWLDVKANLPLLTQQKYYSQLTYGYARGHEAYRYVENIRRYHQSLVGYLQSQEKKQKTLEIAKKSHVYVVVPNENSPLSSYVMPDVVSAKVDITPKASANLGVFNAKENTRAPNDSLGKYILAKPTRSSSTDNNVALQKETSIED